MSNLRLHIPDDMPLWFDAINRHVQMPLLLDFYELDPRIEDRPGNMLIGPCPLHHGNEINEFYVYTDWNMWCCYGACRRGGSPLDFVSLKERVDYPTAALLLQAWFSFDVLKLGLVKEGDVE